MTGCLGAPATIERFVERGPSNLLERIYLVVRSMLPDIAAAAAGGRRPVTRSLATKSHCRRCRMSFNCRSARR